MEERVAPDPRVPLRDATDDPDQRRSRVDRRRVVDPGNGSGRPPVHAPGPWNLRAGSTRRPLAVRPQPLLVTPDAVGNRTRQALKSKGASTAPFEHSPGIDVG